MDRFAHLHICPLTKNITLGAVKKIVTIIAVPVLILLVFCSYTYIKNYRKKAEAIRLYREGLKPIMDKNNQFNPQAELNFYDSLLKQPMPQDQLFVIFAYRALDLLKLGKEKEAAEILENIYKVRGGNEDQFSKLVEQNLALSYLRLGERNNCVHNHSSESCIFPIQGSGIYTDPYASQKAIQLYENILKKDSGDLSSRWLLNIAYMTLGTYPSQVPARWLIPGMDKDSSVYKVKAFKNMAGDLGIAGPMDISGGTIVDDFNNDGYLDIVTSSTSLDEPMHFYKNNGDGTFTDASESSGIGLNKGGLNLIQADYNNDGYADIFVLRGAWYGEFGKQPNTLLKNNGDGTFTDVTIESGLLSFHPTQTGTWADFNNDGWLDLFIGNETMTPDHPHPAELYINNQDGTFTNVAPESGTAVTQFMKGVVTADYNNDGWPDIFVSCFDGKRILLKNKGIKGKVPQFEDVTKEAGLDKEITSTFPTWFWDYDNDGWPDIFECGYEYGQNLASTLAAEALNRPMKNPSRMYLYHNNHDGTFTNVAKQTGLERPVFAMGSNFGDIDNDGWLDMYLGTGNPDFKSLIPNRMFKNISGQQFVEVTGSARVGNLQKGHGVAFADVNNDGSQDIYINVGGAYLGDAYFNSFYVNPGQNNNKWISILLEGDKSNRSAIGAHISVSFNDSGSKRTVYMDVNSGGSFGANPLRKEIGIGRTTVIDELIIKWPATGTIQKFKNVTPNQFIKIKEGVNQIEKMNLKVLDFKVAKGDTKMMDMPDMK
jgi:tetratricopeptide (TPR) repeat protein